MTLSIRNDFSRPGGGYALLEGPGLTGVTAISIENCATGQYLEEDGTWGKRPFVFPVEAASSGGLLLGPHIVDHVPSDLQIALRSDIGAELGKVFWPDIIVSIGRPPAASARLGDIRSSELTIEELFRFASRRRREHVAEDPQPIAPMSSRAPEGRRSGSGQEDSWDAEIFAIPMPSAAPPPTPSAALPPMPSAAPPPMPSAAPPPMPSAAPRKSVATNRAILLGMLGAIVAVAVALYLARRGLRDIGSWLGGIAHSAALPPLVADRQDSTVVDLSVYAPPQIMPTFLVQVFVHDMAEDEGRIEAMATAADASSSRRGIATLDIEVGYGEALDITLEAPGLQIQEDRQTIVWRGKPRSCVFLASAPATLPAGPVVLRVRAYREAIPVGQVTFTMDNVATAAPTNMMPVGDMARRYRRAFLSYASSDRGEVIKRAQALRAGHIEFFQDVLSLEPGERWERRLYAEIDQCDLFILFWSQAARRSPWVAKEIAHALACQTAKRGEGRPEILPILLEGPPPTKPPTSLGHMHFNDPFLYVIADTEQRRSRLKT